MFVWETKTQTEEGVDIGKGRQLADEACVSRTVSSGVQWSSVLTGNAEKLPKACWELFPPGVKEPCGIYTHLLAALV